MVEQACIAVPLRKWSGTTVWPLRGLAIVLLMLSGTTIACSSPTAPSIANCQYYHTGTLALVNLSNTGNPRDVYVDGRFLGVVPYQSQLTATADAGALHTVEWVSSVTGNTVDSIRVVVDECSTATVTNVY